MAFDVKSTLERIASYLAADGKFRTVSIGEPKALAPGAGLCAAVYMSRVAVSKVYVGGDTEEVHVVMVRLYRDMLLEPVKDMEVDIAAAVQRVLSDLLGDFDLGATVKGIDAAGMNGVGVGAEWGYVDLGGKLFRVADITLPVLVDGSATAAP